MEYFNMQVGFSTGTLFQSDFEAGISHFKSINLKTMELSALREHELVNIVNSLEFLDLESFDYISFHAPSKLSKNDELQTIDLLKKIYQKGWNIIVHPDIIQDFNAWRIFENKLCIENMDKRKSVGQTVYHLEEIFNKLPDAQLCFDVGHARQVDPTMIEAINMAKTFKSRIAQIHLSHVNSESKHERLNLESILAFQELWQYIPKDLPIILESIVPEYDIDNEIKVVNEIVFQKKALIFSDL